MKATYASIWRIAWPIMAASLVQNSVSVFDTIFLGYVSETALAAGGVGVVFFLALGFIGFGLGTGVQVLSSHALGEQAPERLPSILRQALWVGLGIGLLLLLTTYAFAPLILPAILKNPAITEVAVYFLRWRSFELLPLILFGVLRGYFSGIAYTKPIFYANLLTSSLNLLLNALFVIVLGWGVRGVVLGSVLAQYLATLYLLLALRSQPYSLRRHEGASSYLRPLFRYAGPAILQNLVGMSGWFVFFLVIEHRGQLALAAANIVRTIYSFSMLPTWGFSAAVGTLVGYFWGAKDPSSLRIAFGRGVRLSLLINLAIAAAVVLLAPFLVRLFTEEEAIQAQAQKDLWMIAISLVLMPPSAILISTVVAMSLVGLAFVVEVVIILAYVGYFLMLDAYQVPLTFLWSAEWIYWIPSTLVLGYVYQWQLRRLSKAALALSSSL